MSSYILLLLFSFLSQSVLIVKAYGQVGSGVLLANSSSDGLHEFCLYYFTDFHQLPSSKSLVEWKPLEDYEGWDLCDGPPPRRLDYRGAYVMAPLRNCSLEFQAQSVVEMHGSGVLLILDSGPSLDLDDMSINITRARALNITVAIINNLTSDNLTRLMPVEVGLYSPDSFLDLSLATVWIIALFCITLGSWWSGKVRHSLRRPHRPLDNGCPEPTRTRSKLEEESSLHVTPLVIALFVVLMGSVLVLLYFFYAYLVYIILGLFMVASIMSVYLCLEALLSNLLCWPRIMLRKLYGNVELKQLVFFTMAASLSISWLIYRKHKCAWILQDILGVFFCVNTLKSIRLPSFKICTVLLVLLFIYDIFFVFITPFFTMKGDSIMATVATGGKSNEQLPMLFKVPRLLLGTNCQIQQDSILGFGDILVPGLLVSYCYGFDLLVGHHCPIYYLLSVAAYGAGMLITFAGLYLMAIPQPALLYLVPCILIPTALLALCRGHWAAFWSGGEDRLPLVRLSSQDCMQVEVPQSLPQPAPSTTTTTTTNGEEEDQSPVLVQIKS